MNQNKSNNFIFIFRKNGQVLSPGRLDHIQRTPFVAPLLHGKEISLEFWKNLKIEGNTPEEKDWLERIDNCSDMS